MRACMEEIRMLLQARQGCIWVRTYEEDAFIQDLRELLQQKYRNMKLNVWSHTEGVRNVPIAKGEAPEEPDARMREIPALFNRIGQELRAGNTSDNRNGGPIAYVLRDLHNLMSDARTRRCIRDTKEYSTNRYIPIIVVSPVQEIHDEVSRLFSVVEYDLPNKKLIEDKIQSASARMISVMTKGATDKKYSIPSKEEIPLLVNSLVGLTQKEINSLLMRSMVKNQKIDLNYLTEYKIESIQKSGALGYRNPHISLQDIGGHSVFKDWFNEQQELFKPAARQFGLPFPKGILCLGPAGTGKTAMAEAVAGSLGAPLLILEMSKIMSRMVGQSEQNIANALSVAKASAPCVILIDECEKSLGGILSSNQSDSGIISRVFQSLLRFMQDNDSGVYVVMTSNDVSQLPPEFTRTGRLDAIWFFDLPDEEARKEIFNIHLNKFSRSLTKKQMETAIEATDNFTGAEIESVVKNLMRKIFLRTRGKKTVDIKEEDILGAVEEITPVYKTNAERIKALQQWCKGRARWTDGRNKEDKTSSDNNPLGDLNF